MNSVADPTDSPQVLLTCGDSGLSYGSRALAGVPRLVLPDRSGRADIDPVLASPVVRRLLVAGTDAALAAVLLRLLRADRLDVELAYLPVRRSPCTTAWRLPRGDAAAALAVDGTASPVPLVRDDAGGVLVGRAEVRDLVGECYCDATLVLRGHARRLVVEPRPGGLGVRASRTGRPPDGRVRAVPARAPHGRGSATGRAVQVGGAPFAPVLDGVAHPRPLPRWAWYRHQQDWLFVIP